MEIAWLIVGLLLGAAVAWYIAKLKAASGAILEQKVRDLAQEKDLLKEEMTEDKAQIIDLSKQLSGKEADFKNLQERLEEQKGELQQIQEKLSKEFQILANKIFEEKSKKFTDQNKLNLTELLDPLKEKITHFENKVDQTNKESIARNSALREQLKSLRF